jgi:hypothetical protein
VLAAVVAQEGVLGSIERHLDHSDGTEPAPPMPSVLGERDPCRESALRCSQRA